MTRLIVEGEFNATAVGKLLHSHPLQLAYPVHVVHPDRPLKCGFPLIQA